MSAFHGIFTPLVTPLTEDESLDLASLTRLVRFQLEYGVHGLWAMGTTAEFAAFDEDERAVAIETTVQAADGAVPVIANVSDASTRLTLRHARRAVEAGADAIAATPPYYFPHSQDEVLAHYRALRDAVSAPIYIYNIPQTVRVRVELGTAKILAEEGTTAGIKDSQNDLEYLRQLALFVSQRALPFTVFAGTRFLIDAAVLCGAAGAIPSAANAFPDLCVAVYEAASAGNYATSARIEARIIEIEAAAGLAVPGSRNAAVVGMLKAILVGRGVISTPTVTSPLRGIETEEWHQMREHVARATQVAAPH